MVNPEALGPVMSNPLWSQENVAEQTDYGDHGARQKMEGQMFYYPLPGHAPL